MESSSNQVWQASLAINHLNEVIHDLRTERDRLAASRMAECERHASLKQSVDAWMAEFHEIAGDLQAMTEDVLEAVAEVDCSGPDADALIEGARLMSVQRMQIKAMREWLQAQRGEMSLASDDIPSRRVSRLNHLSGPAPLSRGWGSSSSEWDELSFASDTCSSGGSAPEPTLLSKRF